LELGKEQGFFDAIGEWPVLQESLEKRNGECPILGKEQHRASQELFVELGASLYFMKWDDNILEENDVFISEWDSKTTNNTSQNIEKFSSSIELVSLMDQSEEALVDGLSNHLPSWHKFGIKLVKNVLKVVSFDGLFGIEKLEEFLHELWSYVHFKRSNFDSFVNNQLKEEFINSLEMWPCWLDFIFLLNTGF